MDAGGDWNDACKEPSAPAPPECIAVEKTEIQGGETLNDEGKEEAMCDLETDDNAESDVWVTPREGPMSPRVVAMTESHEKAEIHVANGNENPKTEQVEEDCCCVMIEVEVDAPIEPIAGVQEMCKESLKSTKEKTVPPATAASKTSGTVGSKSLAAQRQVGKTCRVPEAPKSRGAAVPKTTRVIPATVGTSGSRPLTAQKQVGKTLPSPTKTANPGAIPKIPRTMSSTSDILSKSKARTAPGTKPLLKTLPAPAKTAVSTQNERGALISGNKKTRQLMIKKFQEPFLK